MASRKYRNFSAVMYEQPNIKNISAQRWAYILHDRDIERDGSTKKAHYHILLEFVNPRSVSSVAKMLGIAENMVEIVYSVEGSRLYLTHANAPDKTQYDISEVIANYDVENVDKPLSFLEIYDMVEKSENFKEFITEMSTYRIPQSLSTYNMLCGIWRNHCV